jgi:hypothetical protein|tara:strand:- start:818 stop:1003 length:186 start_codon:yes stop_codon:yes gene_type:complete
MMEKNQDYWNTHKEIYNDLLNELDIEIINKVMENPSGPESKRLNQRVENRVKEKLQMARMN